MHAAAVAVDAESANDMRAVLTGVYASPVGCLCTYDNVSTPGQIAPSIHQPATAYGNTYNYFDPDNFFALTALMALTALTVAKAVAEVNSMVAMTRGEESAVVKTAAVTRSQ